MQKLKENNLIAQHNSLIEGSYSVTKNELILLVAMISLISPDDRDFLTFSVTVEELAEILNLDKKSALREFRKVSKRLLKRVVEIKVPNGWDMFQWVSKSSLRDNVVYVHFHKDLKPHLLELKKSGNFTQYRLGMTAKFRSAYTIRMYQILMAYYSKKIYRFEFSLQYFRDMILGRDSKTHPVFKNFRRHVLNVSQMELSEKDPHTGLYKSDLGFTLETRRTGRKISHLIFTIQKQATQPIKQSTNNKSKPNTAPAPQIILDYEFYGLDRLIVEPFLKKRGEQALINTLEKFKRDKERGAIQKNEQGYLRQLLKTNAGQATQSEKADAQQKQQQAIAAEAEQQARQHDELISQYKREFGDSTRKRFLASLSNEQLEQIKNELIQEHQGNSFVIERIRKGELLSPLVMSSLNEWIPDFYQQEEDYISEKLAEANNS